jgi:large subunit ribosomal protein L4e
MPAVFSIQGQKVKDIQLPKIFETAYQPELIKRAVLAVQTSRLQPHSTKAGAGRTNTAEYIGMRGKPNRHRTINVGRARLPRLKNRRAVLYGQVAGVPQAVGGPKAHPPKKQARKVERINVKERKAAIASAVAATVNEAIVKERGHLFDKNIFPVIVDNSFEKLDKTKEVVKALQSLKVRQDVESAKEKRKVRAGKNKNRGHRYKQKKSLLIVTNGTKPVYKAARNLPGVEVVQVKSLNASNLAPGTLPGRLTVWTEEAVQSFEKERDR